MAETLKKLLETAKSEQGDIVQSFLDENFLAREVVVGKTSYRIAIKPIEEEYSS